MTADALVLLGLVVAGINSALAQGHIRRGSPRYALSHLLLAGVILSQVADRLFG